MLPRHKVDSDPVATATMERIRRSLDERPQPILRREPWTPSFSLGLLLAFFALVAVWLSWPRTPNVEWLLKATPPIPRAELVKWNPHVPRAELVSLGQPTPKYGKFNWGDTFWVMMPDGRWIVVTAMGRANTPEELPLTGNRIGDARWVGDSCFVWLNPIGQTNPTWIDP